MNKICGYSCEHNKGGVCQITVCDKKLIMSDKTEVQMPIRYIDTAVTELQQNKQLKEYQKALDETMSEKIDIENNWNKLKEYIIETKLKEFEKSYGKRYGKTFTQAEIIVCNMILNKMQELEESDSNEKNNSI